MKIGRNEKCFCGSGLKYKKCCLLDGSKKAIDASNERLKKRALNQSCSHSEDSPLYFRDIDGVEKMSEIIIDFATPLLDSAEGVESQKKAITIAITAWNISLMPNIDTQTETLEELMFSGEEQFPKDMSLIIAALIQRKLNHYSDIKRIIMDYDMINTSEGFHLNIASSCMRDDENYDTFEKEAKRLGFTRKQEQVNTL